MLILGVLLAGSSARGEPSAEVHAKATALLREGARFVEERHYERAVDTFHEAYRLVPNAKILFNLGVAYSSWGRNADALTAFEAFIQQATDAPPSGIANARRHIAELRAKVGVLTFDSDRTNGAVNIDGRDLGTIPLDGELIVDPGRHQFRATASDQTVERQVEVAAGGRTDLMLRFGPFVSPTPAAVTGSSLGPLAVAPTSTLPQSEGAPPLVLTASKSTRDHSEVARPFYRRPWFWVATGGAVAVAAVALAVALGHAEYPTINQVVAGP